MPIEAAGLTVGKIAIIPIIRAVATLPGGAANVFVRFA
jgi:hypothetical protein